MPYPHMFAEEFQKQNKGLDNHISHSTRPLNEVPAHNIRRLKHNAQSAPVENLPEPLGSGMHSLIQSRSLGVKVANNVPNFLISSTKPPS
jgi:hypothetical protein